MLIEAGLQVEVNMLSASGAVDWGGQEGDVLKTVDGSRTVPIDKFQVPLNTRLTRLFLFH